MRFRSDASSAYAGSISTGTPFLTEIPASASHFVHFAARSALQVAGESLLNNILITLECLLLAERSADKVPIIVEIKIGTIEMKTAPNTAINP